MSQRYSSPSTQILRRPSPSVFPPYRDDKSDPSQNKNGKRSHGDLWDDHVETPQKRARLDGDHHSVREKSQQPSNLGVNASNQDRKQEFVDGPGHVIFIDERGKRCPAICFNDLFLHLFKQIVMFRLELEERDEALEKAQLDLEQITSTNQSYKIEKAKRMVEEALKDLKDAEAEEIELVEARRRYEALTQKNNWSKLKLENSKNCVLNSLREILTRENFLEFPPSKPQEPAEDTGNHPPRSPPAPEKTANYQNDAERFNRAESSVASTRLHSPNDTEEGLTPQDLAYEQLIQADRELEFHQREFDYTEEARAGAMAGMRRFRQDQYPGGPEAPTQTELDLRDLLQKQRATRNLIEAEEAYDRAEQHAKALGLGNALAGAYVVALIPEMFPVDRARVESWLASIPDPAVVDPQRQLPAAESAEVDDWDAKSVELYDSTSLVDQDMYRKRIDEWREMSGRVRRARLGGPVRGTVRRNPRRLCRDGHSASGSPRARS